MIDLGNVFSLVFHSVVVSDFLFSGNIFNSGDSFIVNDGFFIRNVFDSGFALKVFSAGVDDLRSSDILRMSNVCLNLLNLGGSVGKADGRVAANNVMVVVGVALVDFFFLFNGFF